VRRFPALLAVLTVIAAGAFGVARLGDDGAASTSPVSTTATTAPSIGAPVSRGCPLRPGDDAIEPAGTPAVGLASNLVWDAEVDVEGELAVLAACGVSAIREDLLWEVVEPVRGRFDWATTDRIMWAARDAGVGVLGILGYAAPWASSDPEGEGARNYAPEDDDAFAAYAAAVAARYDAPSDFWDGAGSEFRPLVGLEIWNEAWAYWAWKPDPDPAAYASLATATATAIRRVAPGVPIVLTADPFQHRSDGGRPPWFEAVLDAAPDLPELVDVYAVHPYPDPRGSSPTAEGRSASAGFDRVALVDDIARERDVRRPVWITEVGWSTSDARGGVSEEDQAAHTVAAIERTQEEWPFVERFFVYTWARDRAPTDDIELGFGLRRQDGSPKPALEAILDLLVAREADEDG